MSGIHSIKSNIFFNLLKTFLSLVFPLITFPYVSRVLGPDGVGKVNYASSIVSYFVIFAGLGIGAYGIREGAKVRDDKQKLTELICELLIITFVAMLVAYIAFFIVVFTVPQISEFRALLLVLGVNIFFNVIGIEWLYSALEEFRYITIRSFCFQLLSLILIFTFVKTSDDFFKYAVITIISASGSNVFNFLHARKFLNRRLIQHLDWGRHLKSVFIMFGTAITASVLTMLDTTMVGLISGTYQVGLYTTALKIVKLICGLIAVISSTLLPSCSYYLENADLEKFNKLVVQSFFVTLFLCVPAVLLVIVNAKLIILILSGSLYAGAIPCIKILAPVIAFSSITLFINYQLLLPYGKEKINLFVLMIGTFADFILNIVLIPNWKALGACIGTLVAESVMFFINIFFLLRYFGLRPILRIVFPIFVALLLFLLTCTSVSMIELKPYWDALLPSFCGVLAYVFAVCLMCRSRIKEFVRRRK